MGDAPPGLYDRLMKDFNALHERIYQTHKDHRHRW